MKYPLHGAFSRLTLLSFFILPASVDPFILPADSAPRWTIAGDFTEDGFEGLTAPNEISNSVSIRLNNGEGTPETDYTLWMPKTMGLPGQFVDVPVSLGIPLDGIHVGGYEVLLTWDPSCMNLITVEETPIDAFFSEDFTANIILDDPKEMPLVRVVSVRNTFSNEYTPPIPPGDQYGIFNLIFQMDTDWDPNDFCRIEFVVRECGDNSISDTTGVLLVSNNRDTVCHKDIPRWIALNDSIAHVYGPGPCLVGDVNLNEEPYEASDVSSYNDQLLGDLWSIGWTDTEIFLSTCNSDINQDDGYWTIADLTLLTAIVSGFAEPPPAPIEPIKNQVVNVSLPAIAQGEAVVTTEYAGDLAGAYFIVAYQGTIGTPTLANRTAHMDLSYNNLGKEFRVLVTSDGSRSIPGGSGPLFTIPVNGEAQFTASRIEFSDPEGHLLTGSVTTPAQFTLYSAHPNPFSDKTVIPFALPRNDFVSLKVYDVNGQRVKTLLSASRNAGLYSATWDGTDERGKSVPQGVYLYRLETGSWNVTKKLVFLR